MKPDRVVVGADDIRAAEILRDLYAPFVRTGSPVLIADVRTAELLKYAANAFLAARISFMNEIANLCEHVGANVDMIRKGLAADSRIGQHSQKSTIRRNQLFLRFVGYTTTESRSRPQRELSEIKRSHRLELESRRV